jgi:hypothetical protein
MPREYYRVIRRPRVTASVTLTLHQLAQVSHIREIWSDTLLKNLEVGRVLADLGIHKSAWDSFNLPIGYSWGRRLIKIAHDERILANLDIMPDSRATLHEISCLTDILFRRAKYLGIISREVTARDIRDWRRAEQGIADRCSLTRTVTIEEGHTRGLSVYEIAQKFQSGFEHLCRELPGVKITFSRDRGLDWDWKEPLEITGAKGE